MLAAVGVEHELNQRAMQPRDCAPHHCETATGEFRRRLEIEQAQPGSKVDKAEKLQVQVLDEQAFEKLIKGG